MERRSYLPREVWHQLREKIPMTPIDSAAMVEITRQAAGDAFWRKLWGGDPRQRLLRKMFALASAPSMTTRDLVHLAFNAGQVEASGALDKLERLAESTPDLAALRIVANIYVTLKMGTLRAYVKPEMLTEAASLSDADITAITRKVSAKFPEVGRGGAGMLVLAVCVVILIIIAYYAGKLATGGPRAVYAAVAISALVGGGAIYLLATRQRGRV
jgi:hypothetical protein